MITFVIPYFFEMFESSGLHQDFSTLGRMLSKAKMESLPSASAYELICRVLEVEKDACASVAALKMLAETGQQPTSWVCCASPVVISPNRDHLDLAHVSGFDITTSEAESFCEELNDYFKDDDFHFSFVTPSQWYCQSNAAFDVSDASPFIAAGGDIAAHIPHGPQGVTWRKIFNDVQMLLHHSATNHKRAQLGKPEINSLWFWGGGELTSQEITIEKSVLTDDVFVKGFSLLGKTQVQTLPKKMAAEILDNDVFIADLESLNWLDWDVRFFTPALKLLNQGKIKQISIHLDLKRQFTLRKTDRLKFWLPQKVVSGFNQIR